MTSAAITNPEIAQKALGVLLIEDDPDYANLVALQLQAGDVVTKLRLETCLEGGLNLLQEDEFDVILLDLTLPDSRGLDSVLKVLSVTAVPVVVLTAVDDEHIAAESLKLGAQDYLIKPRIDPHTLVKSIRYAIQRQGLVDELNSMRAADKEIKEKFFSHVSHELRTPLTAVLQFVTILQDGLAGELNAEQQDYLAIIRRNSDQLKHMISTLMDATQADAGKLSYNMKLMDLGEVVENTVAELRMTAQEKSIELDAAVKVKHLAVLADRARITQVVSNLISNAIKFTPESGRVHVTLDQDPERQDFIRVSVEDNGCGISETSVKHVFDRMYQVESNSRASRKGLGLGLHICREIVTHHGGAIGVTSQELAGSTFHFAIPIYSFKAVLRRVVEVNGTLEPHVGLVSVRISPIKGGSTVKSRHAAAEEAAKCVARCLIGTSDAVVPAREGSDDAVVFALARTDRAGMEVIGKRIREELARCKRLEVWGYQTEVQARAYEVGIAEGPDSAGHLGRLVKRLRSEMKTIEEGAGE